MDKLDELKKRIEEVQGKSLMASDMKSFITLVLSIVKKNKDELDSLSKEHIELIKKALDYITSEHKVVLSDLRKETSKQKKDFSLKIDEVKSILYDIKKLPPLEKIIEKTEVIHEIPVVTNEVKEIAITDTGEEIVAKINDLTLDDSNKIDAKHIKNLPNTKGGNFYGGSGIKEVVAGTNITIDNSNLGYPVISSSGGGGTPGGSSGDIQWNNAGSFDGFGTFNGTNQLDLTGISITSAGLTTTGIFQQSGDQAVFDVAGSNFAVKTTTYTGYGLINADNTGIVSIGDFFGDGNNTYISLDDTATTLEYKATSGHAFIGQVATGAGVSSVAGSANVPLTVTETINGYVGLQVQNLSDGTTASSDFVVANDIDDGDLVTGHYLDIGIGSSTNADPLFPALNGANNTYMYAVGGKLSIGTATANKSINFFTGGLEYSNRRMVITSAGNIGFWTIAPNNAMSIAPVRYLTGTASQSGTTVTGVGTTWTSAMVGDLFEFDDGTTAGTITAFTSATSLEVSVSQTVSSQTYSIHYLGIEVSPTGAVGLGTINATAKLDVVTNNLVTTQTNTSGIVLSNNTLATASVTRQISPAIRWRGNAWKSNATAASQTVDFNQYVVPNTGAAAVTGDLFFTASINGGAYSSLMALSSAGVLTMYQAATRVIDVSASSTTIIGLRIQNTNNSTASSVARNEITVGGSSGGDPQTNYVVSGTTDWVTGIDNSDSDSFKLSQNATLGTNDRFIMTTAGLFSLRAGLSTKRATVGGGIKEYFTSVGNVTTGEDDLYTYTTEANIFGTNGDNIKGQYSGTTAANANNKTFKFYFAGTNILNSGALALNDKNWKFTYELIRVSATVVRYSVQFDYEGNTATVLEVGELTGLTLSGTNILKITGEATATNDIVATMGVVTATPASI